MTERVTLNAPEVAEGRRTVREVMDVVEVHSRRGRTSMPIDILDATLLAVLAGAALEQLAETPEGSEGR